MFMDKTFQRQIDVYGLRPNTSYEFKVWATNQLGRGESTQLVSTTKGYFSEEGNDVLEITMNDDVFTQSPLKCLLLLYISCQNC